MKDMHAKHINIHFLDQFHQEYLVFPGKKEQQYNALLFKQFAGRKKEIPNLLKLAEQKLDDSEIISRLITHLQEENIPDYFRLSNFARKLQRQMSFYVMNEHLNTKYDKRVLRILKPFIHLIDDFQQVQQQLLNRLIALRKSKKNQARVPSFDSKKTDDVIIIMEKFVDHLYEHYNHFNSCIDQNSDDSKGVATTTYTEHYMTNVVSLIEQLMYDTKSAQTLLEYWRTRLANRELQVIYN